MENMQPAEESSPWTDEFEFTHSVFEISSIPIRYYLTNVKLSSLEDTFELVEDIPGSIDWGYNAIFQRDIDHERVENELLGKYLLDKDRYKFFSPLTIALLPYDAAEKDILNNYRDTDQPDDDENWKRERVGYVKIESLKGMTVGKIKWNKNKVVGTAIDGQHRLLALMKYAKHQRRPEGIDPSEVRIPVTLLVFDQDEGDILPQVRQIFVDINKNAKPVSKARRILLDDKDPFAVFARDLVENQQDSEGDGLRYEVVDWKKGSSKPKDNQLTTIVALYEIVKNIFNDDIASLESELNLNSTFEDKGYPQIKPNEDDIDSLSQSQVEEALRKYRGKHRDFVLGVFKNLPPYVEFVDQVSEFIDGDEISNETFKEYLFTPPNKREEFISDEVVDKRDLDPDNVIYDRLEKLERMKGEPYNSGLLYNSIGQRGLFYNFSKIRKLYRSQTESYSLESISKEYVEDLSTLIDNDFFSRSKSIDGFQIWQRICILGGNISVSDSSARRFGSLVLLAVASLRANIATLEDVREFSSEVSLKGDFGYTQRAYKKYWVDKISEQREEQLSQDDPEDLDSELFEEDVDDIAEDRSKKTVESILSEVSGWDEDDSATGDDTDDDSGS